MPRPLHASPIIESFLHNLSLTDSISGPVALPGERPFSGIKLNCSNPPLSSILIFSRTKQPADCFNERANVLRLVQELISASLARLRFT